MFADPSPENRFSPYRWVSVLLRSIHVAATAVVLGGVFLGAGYETLVVFIWTAILSGCAMLSMDVIKGPRVLLQASGLTVLLKLALLGVGAFLLPCQRFGWYLAATLIASVGSHAPGHWRHYEVFTRSKRSA
jgi:hypothetical protein